MDTFNNRYKEFERLRTFTTDGENFLKQTVERNDARKYQQERREQLSHLFKLVAYALRDKYDQAKMLTELEKDIHSIPEDKKTEIVATLASLPEGLDALANDYNLIVNEKVVGKLFPFLELI